MDAFVAQRVLRRLRNEKLRRSEISLRPVDEDP